MRKLALLAAVALSAAFFATPSTPSYAQGTDLNPNTTKFVRDAWNPYAATAQPAAAAKAAKKKKGKKKKG
jgi:hypothetical protein